MLVAPPHLPEFQEATLRLAEEFTTGDREGAAASTVAGLLGGAHLVFLEWGFRPRAEDVQRQLEDLAERTREPQVALYAGVCRLQMRIVDGRLDEALASALAMQEEYDAAGASVVGISVTSGLAFQRAGTKRVRAENSVVG
jgi:hypothetical protein